MPRLTISLSEERYQALKNAAAKRRKSLVAVIDESLDFYGIKSQPSAAALVAQARARSALSEADAIATALEEVDAVRHR